MPKHPIRISVQVPPQHVTIAQMRDMWLRAEDAGVDAVYNWDHFYPLSGDPAGLHFEAYTLLAAMAEVTDRVQIGSLVTCNSYRNPNLLADMARTIDHLSDGRFVLGIGSGWAERDYENYGYPFGTAASRLQDLKRDLPIIRDRWTKLNPGPVNGTIPILIGGGGEKVTLRIVAEHANTWHTFGDVDTAKRKAGILDQHCATVGRDPSEIVRSVGVGSAKDGSTDEAIRIAEAHVANGFSDFTTGIGAPDFDFSLVKALVAWRDSVNG